MRAWLLLIALLLPWPSSAATVRRCPDGFEKLARGMLSAEYSLTDWRHNVLLNRALVTDPYSREALDIISTVLVATHDLPGKKALANRRLIEGTRKLAEVFRYEPGYGEFLVSDHQIEMINDLAKKVLAQSEDLERDLKFLRMTGLRDFLGLVPFRDRVNSLAWWMEKEALPSFPLGRGGGKTAAELNLVHIKHGTKKEFLPSIVPHGETGKKPNVLNSRPDIEGEAADFGAGHYCIREEIDIPVPSSATVHYEVDPRARAGTDFKVVWDDRDMVPYIVVLNRAAVRVTGFTAP